MPPFVASVLAGIAGQLGVDAVRVARDRGAGLAGMFRRRVAYVGSQPVPTPRQVPTPRAVLTAPTDAVGPPVSRAAIAPLSGTRLARQLDDRRRR